jgi:hypothetical protein
MAKAIDKPTKKAARRKAAGGNDVASRVRRHRDKMKAAGLKPVTIWVPDVNAAGFKDQIAREIELINNSADEKVILEELSHIEIDG